VAAAGFAGPMLAHPYDDVHRKHVRFPCVVQPKLDGVRMLASLSSSPYLPHPTLVSRTGKSFAHLLPLFERDLAAIAGALSAAGADDLVLDGELYAHGRGFQHVVSLAKNTNADKVAGAAGTLKYHVYDLYVPGAPGAAFRERGALLRRLVEGVGSGSSLALVQTDACGSAAELTAFLDRFVREGYEGVMVRDPAAPYAPGKRSNGLLKLKRFHDAEYEIVAVEEATGKDAGTAIFVCCLPVPKAPKAAKAKTTFRVRPVGTQQERAAMLAARARLVGKMLTVRYQELSDGGVPRFPVGVAVRDYE
jgi:ATP-dependent DNA ligase